MPGRAIWEILYFFHIYRISGIYKFVLLLEIMDPFNCCISFVHIEIINVYFFDFILKIDFFSIFPSNSDLEIKNRDNDKNLIIETNFIFYSYLFIELK